MCAGQEGFEGSEYSFISEYVSSIIPRLDVCADLKDYLLWATTIRLLHQLDKRGGIRVPSRSGTEGRVTDGRIPSFAGSQTTQFEA